MRSIPICVLGPVPAPIPECIAWAVLPRDRVLRDYVLELVHALAPQIDKRDLRRVLNGHQEPDWPSPPSWQIVDTDHYSLSGFSSGCVGAMDVLGESRRWWQGV